MPPTWRHLHSSTPRNLLRGYQRNSAQAKLWWEERQDQKAVSRTLHREGNRRRHIVGEGKRQPPCRSFQTNPSALKICPQQPKYDQGFPCCRHYFRLDLDLEEGVSGGGREDHHLRTKKDIQKLFGPLLELLDKSATKR